MDSAGRKLFPFLSTVWQKLIFTNLELAGYTYVHENSTKNTNGLTDGRTDGRVLSQRKTAFYVQKNQTITNLQI